MNTQNWQPSLSLCLVACFGVLALAWPSPGPCTSSYQDPGVEPRITVHSLTFELEGKAAGSIPQHTPLVQTAPLAEHLEPCCMSSFHYPDFTCWPLLWPPGASPEQ